MSIIAQYLFGSHARRDFSPTSDLDLLSITDDATFKNFSRGQLAISFYPEVRFIEAAIRGDLFVMHIVREAVLVYDAKFFHRRLIESFKYKANYNKEIRQATELGWFIYKHASEVRSASILNRRIAWCVRTILIARMVMAGKPTFNAEHLADFAGTQEAAALLASKSADLFDPLRIEMLGSFLSQFGDDAAMVKKINSIRGYWYHFRSDDNAIALKLIDNVIDSVSKDIYES